MPNLRWPLSVTIELNDGTFVPATAGAVVSHPLFRCHAPRFFALTRAFGVGANFSNRW
jgi:hypothetical protein